MLVHNVLSNVCSVLLCLKDHRVKVNYDLIRLSGNANL